MILIRSNKSQTKSQIRIRSLHLKLESYIGSYVFWPLALEVQFLWLLIEAIIENVMKVIKLFI